MDLYRLVKKKGEQVGLSCLFPELFAWLKVASCGEPLWQALLVSLVFRLAWLSAELSHGASHTLMRALLDQTPSVICLENLLEHRSPRQLLLGLLPLGSVAAGGDSGRPWLHAGEPRPWKLRLKAGSPLLVHLLSAVGALSLLLSPSLSPSLTRAELLGSWRLDLLLGLLFSHLWLLIASRTDLHTLISGQGSLLYCGNFGLIAARSAPLRGELLSAQALQIFQSMGRDTELRGAQAGGGLVIALDRQGGSGFVGHKIVNAKRGDLTPSLEVGFRKQRRRARRGGWKPHPAGLVACWHYRFGTSGPPAVAETHWQEWTPGRHCWLWQQGEDGHWRSRWRRVHHRITHNGDFEAFDAFGAVLELGSDLGPWLEQALQIAAPAVVDSARIAGMMDLMICQGDWYAAVRWAFLSELARFPTTAPSQDLQRWAMQFEATFRGLVEANVPSEPLLEPMIEHLLPWLQAQSSLLDVGCDRLRRWIALSLELFLHNDPATAVLQFMERARGSFGLMVVSTTWPDRLVLSSLGQPITIGMNPQAALALYASESAAVDAILQGVEGAWRIDLDENAGEVAVLSSLHLAITSLSLQRQLTLEEIESRRQPYGPPSRRRPDAALPRSPAAADPVATDIAAIPGLLAAIHDDWTNPGSRNRQAADWLAQLLIAKAANLAEKETMLQRVGLAESLAKSSQVDLLLTGVENSLWLAEQFARDLASLMPRLTIQVLSSNEVLKALQNDIDSLGLARQSIVLVLSHSGRTFPSRQVMEACDLMVRRSVIREFFVLTGEPDSLQGAALLKPQPGEPFSRRLLSTGAGRRRAEPATASVAAMHQSLTQLLFSLCRQLLQAFPDPQLPPLGLRLSRQQLAQLEAQETELLLRESLDIVGVDPSGQPRPTATFRHLVRGGRQWAWHVLETPFAWAIHAVYILITLELGIPLVQTLVRRQAGESLWTAGTTSAALLQETALLADIAVYVFGPWLWTLALRWLQRRPVLARTGRRTVVIGEAAWIHPLLTNFISKLFALSFGIASLDVQGGDVSDHLLHTHAHRLVRGTLLFFGVPDARGGGRKRADANAALLTARQSDGIRHWNTGPEIVAVGTDPSLRSGPFQRVLVLPYGNGNAAAAPEGGDDSDLGREHDAAAQLIASLRESRYGAFRRLLASYVFFWAMARDVGLLPLLRFKWWRSQSRTRVMTTAAPVSAAQLDLAEPQEIEALALDRAAREQS